MKRQRSQPGKAVSRGLCRYCIPHAEAGRQKCIHCHGYRLPSRREARRVGRNSRSELEAY